MQATFVELPPFERTRKDYMDDEAYRLLQLELMGNPKAGPVIEGTDGLRKLRQADPRRGKGKRGGLRIIYYWWSGGDQFWFFTVYDKDQADDLTPAQRKVLKQLLKTELENRQKRENVMTNKRDIFAELTEGFDALKAEREGKLTLRTFKAENKPAPVLLPQEVLQVREQLRLSRPVFAHYLRTNARTLENWEQGRAKPNAQASLLIRMVAQFPDMVQRLATI